MSKKWWRRLWRKKKRLRAATSIRVDGVGLVLGGPWRPPVITDTPTPSFNEGNSATYDLSQHVSRSGIPSGVTYPITYSLNGTVTAAFTLNASTGVLSYDGSPSASNTLTFTVSDNNGSDTSDEFTLQVVPGTFYVSNSGSDLNNGSFASPFQTVAKVNSLEISAGATINFNKGDSWNESLLISGSGSPGEVITVSAYGSGADPIIQECQLDGSYITVTGIDFDHGGGSNRVVRIRGDNNTIQNCSVHDGLLDGIDIRNGADNTTINNCEIYHLLAGSFGTNDDAHGIGIRAGEGNTITVNVINTTIHEVSGDCIQADPDRDQTGSTYQNYDITINVTGGEWYTQALAANKYGWLAGERPGEDGIDTKADENDNGIIRVNITNLIAHGWLTSGSPHGNPTPFNLKENVSATLNRLTLYDNARAIRLRADSEGNPEVTIKNAVVYDCETGLLVDNGVTNLKVYNNTFGDGITSFLTETGAGMGVGSDLRNNVFLGTKPAAFSDASNIEAVSGDFVDSANNDFRHVNTASTIEEQGVNLFALGVIVDRLGVSRSAPYSIGAYEVGVTTGQHSYYNSLVDDARSVLSAEFSTARGKNQPQIESQITTYQQNSQDPPVYDATLDCAKWTLAAGQESITTELQMYFADQSTGNVLHYWEAYWDDVIADENWTSGTGDFKHKCFMLVGDTDPNAGDDRRLEVRTLYERSDVGKVCKVDLRLYNWRIDADSTPPVDNEIQLNPNVWCRFWAWYDFENDKFSLWVGDELQAPVKVYDNRTVTETTAHPLDGFQFQYASSDNINVEWNVWARNWVALQNLDNLAEAQSLVDSGSQV